MKSTFKYILVANIGRRIGIAVIFMTAVSGFVTAQTQQLPLSSYFSLLPSTFRQFWLDPISGNAIFFDSAGKLNTRFNLNLGTTVTGQVTLRYIGSDMQQFTVTTHTKNALCWGLNGDGQIAFGYNPIEVSGLVGPAALGDGLTRATYAPQPVGPLNRNWPVESIITTINCDGQLRAGSGYPAGADGFAQTTQTALFNTGVPSGCPLEGDADCFPAEKVQFVPTGN
jgi:hypothetical protein